MPPSSDVPTFTVGELNRTIRYALSITFPDEVWVEGEIASLKRHETSGNVYFELVDGDGRGGGAPDAKLSVVLYNANRQAVNHLLRRAATTSSSTTTDDAAPSPAIRMADGVNIRIRGSLDYTVRSGRLQLKMTSIDPAHTLGRLALERDRLVAALAAEGLLDRNRSLPFPLLPSNLALVTSPGSAACADFLDELDASGLGWRVTVVGTRVQGPGAELEIAAALRAAEARGVDVIALVRGGGARTDLLAFDAEQVARTIAALSVPVVTGIGHEIDSSVADTVAAGAHKTPTACAAALVDHARRAVERPAAAWAGILTAGHELLDARRDHLHDTGRRVAFAGRVRLDAAARRAVTNEVRLRTATPVALASSSARIATLSARLDAVDPARALRRGWSITRRADGSVVRDPAALDADEVLVTTVAGGTVTSRVTGTDGTAAGRWGVA